ITEEVQGVELPQRSKRFKDMMEAAEEYFTVLGKAADSPPEERERMKARLDELSMPYSDDHAYQAFLKIQRPPSRIHGNGERRRCAPATAGTGLEMPPEPPSRSRVTARRGIISSIGSEIIAPIARPACTAPSTSSTSGPRNPSRPSNASRRTSCSAVTSATR